MMQNEMLIRAESLFVTGVEQSADLQITEGAAELSPSGRGYGLRARVQRLVQNLGYEGEHLRMIERELSHGHALVGIAVEEATKALVVGVLHRHGAHDVHFYGRFVIEDL